MIQRVRVYGADGSPVLFDTGLPYHDVPSERLHCYYPRVAGCGRWSQVSGPGGVVELDFLSTTRVAERISFQRTLQFSAAGEKLKYGRALITPDEYKRSATPVRGRV